MAQIFYDSSPAPKDIKSKALLLFTAAFARVLPTLSADFALKYLFKPYSRRSYDFRTQVPPHKSYTIKTLQSDLMLHHFSGNGDKHVVLSHGWADTSVRFTYLIDELINQNLNVWVFDHIGHGQSSGNTAHLFGFIDGLQSTIDFIESKDHKVSAILGHSMGALALLNQKAETFENKKIIMMSAPTEFFKNLFLNTKRFGVSNKMLLNALNRVADIYKVPWGELSPEKHTYKIQKDFLMIHDKDDLTCSYENFKNLIKGTEHQFITTTGLGHLKILRDPVVLKQISNFIKTS